MKSEERHHLQENDLQRAMNSARRTFEENAQPILIGLAAVILLLAVGVGVTRWMQSKEQAGWPELAAAETAEDYADVADDFADKPAGVWARLNEARSLQMGGFQLMFADRSAAVSDLKEALESYEKVLDGDAPRPARERALYGLASTHETLGEIDLAKENYQRLLDEFPESIFAEEVEERMQQLEQPQTVAFYNWFGEQDPKPQPPGSDPFGGQGFDPGPVIREGSSDSSSDPPAEAGDDPGPAFPGLGSTPEEGSNSDQPSPSDQTETDPQPDTERPKPAGGENPVREEPVNEKPEPKESPAGPETPAKPEKKPAEEKPGNDPPKTQTKPAPTDADDLSDAVREEPVTDFPGDE